MNIAIIEDNIDMSELVSKKLNKYWYITKTYNSKKDFLLDSNRIFDLYIIDISLWTQKNNEWFSIINNLREQNINSPIIIISWYDNLEKKIYWLDIWADDYIVKPFSPKELLARIRTIIRRNTKCSNSSIIKYNNLEYSLTSKELKVNWEIFKLPKKELIMLELFLLNQNKLISKLKLINYVWWNIDSMLISDNNINVTLSNIRRKFWNNIKIKTMVNSGYVLEKN